jgi:hypothetical protein
MIWNWRNAFIGLACAALLWVLVGPGHSEEARKAEGQAIANELMEQWKRANSNRDWVAEEKERHKIKPPADNSSLLRGGQSEGDVYGKYTKQDILMWERELEKFVVEGSMIFHDADLLGSTIAVSCDMCHPDASNTHPETYPKFQVQMGRVVLLRDMINWCIEQAIRGETFGADDSRMRALEAYILAQRKGIELNYGKH